MSTEKPQEVPKTALPGQSYRDSALQQAMVLFQSRFRYSFTGTSSTPPDAIVPLKLSAADIESKIVNHDPDQVAKYVKKILAKQNVVASWFHDIAEEDLISWITGAVTSPVDSTWKSQSLHKIYYPDDTSQSNTIETDAILFYINVIKTMDKKSVRESTVAYVGVYYEVMTPSAFIRSRLRVDAYNQAATLLTQDDKPITDDKLLAQALAPFSAKYFENQFNYPWDQNPPDFTEGGAYWKADLESLGYFEDGNTNDAESFVKGTLLSGLSIPGWTANTVVSDIIEEFTSIIASQIGGRSWPQIKIYKAFHDESGVHNSLYVNAVVVYYSNAKKSFDGRVLKISYVFWMGKIFEKQPFKTVIYTAMITQLFNNLRDANNVRSDDLPSNEEGLQSLLSRCALSKFKRTFGCDFKGSSTEASDSNGDELYGVECFGKFDDVTDESVATWTKSQIFRDKTFSFFPIVPALKSQFDEQTVFWLTNHTSETTDNNWGNDKFQKTYPDPKDSSKILNTKATVFHANGTKSEAGLNVQANLFYYMGIYYVAKDDESDDDGV